MIESMAGILVIMSVGAMGKELIQKNLRFYTLKHDTKLRKSQQRGDDQEDSV